MEHCSSFHCGSGQMTSKAFVDATKSVYAKWEAGPSGDFVKRVIQQAQ